MVEGMEKHDVKKREREREREEKGMSKEDVEMRWGRGQQRGSSGNCYGDDVSGNWKVVSFVAFVCEMGAIPARRNRHTYILPTNSGIRTIAEDTQSSEPAWSVHNIPKGWRTCLHTVFVLQTLNLETLGGFLPRLWQLRHVWRAGEISTWVNCGPSRIGPHLHRINFTQSVLDESPSLPVTCKSFLKMEGR